MRKHPFAYSVGAQRRCALNRASEEGAAALRPYDGFIIFINRDFSTAPGHRRYDNSVFNIQFNRGFWEITEGLNPPLFIVKWIR